jgi:hypothetical protein
VFLSLALNYNIPWERIIASTKKKWDGKRIIASTNKEMGTIIDKNFLDTLYSAKQKIVKFLAQKQIAELSRDRYLH